MSDRGVDLRITGDLPLAVYEQLKSVARQRMRGERAGHTLQTTALVHEAYVKLLKEGRIDASAKGEFYAAAAQAMRQILIDHARARDAQKRGSGRAILSTDVLELANDADSEQIVALDEAIVRLQDQTPDAARVVCLRFFAGLSIDDT